jgi:hypothetical protein
MKSSSSNRVGFVSYLVPEDGNKTNYRKVVVLINSDYVQQVQNNVLKQYIL